tara:strand:- start:1493 stop:2113 length:621 start_codon:yes stop_codon:yes gene_type:complete
MGWDREREAEKRGEILQSVIAALRIHNIEAPDVTTLADAILHNLVQTSPPEEENHQVHLIIMGHMGRGGGRSTKPGNIRLNIGKLMEAIASGVLTTVGAVQLPFTAPFAALLVWCSLLRSTQVAITETEGCVLYVMWVYKNQDRDIEKSTLLTLCNGLLEKYDKPLLTQGVLNESLSALQKIRAIETSPRSSAKWWLRERAQVSYR